MYVRSPKYGIFLAVWSKLTWNEKFYTHLVFILKTFYSKANISGKPQNTDFLF